MAMIKVALVAKTKAISAIELRRVAAALNRQLKEHFGPIWKIDAQVAAVSGVVPEGHWPVTIRDRIEAPDTISFHSVTKGRPFAEVSYGVAKRAHVNWTRSASHDLLEMLVDPKADRTVRGPAIAAGKPREVIYPLQVCDPCADRPYVIDGVEVSDFTTPRYWRLGGKPGKYSYLGSLTRPFQVLPGGYLNWQDPKTGKWNFLVGKSEGEREAPPVKAPNVGRVAKRGDVLFRNPAAAKYYAASAKVRESSEAVVRRLIKDFGVRQADRRSWAELRAGNLNELYDILNKLSDTQAYVFRGQASAAWDSLQPSLHRSFVNNDDPEESVIQEAKAIKAFRRHARSLLHPSEMVYFDRILDSITLMQHYGAPTRLLDWTLSPWVACYFAVHAQQDTKDEDAVIWSFNWDELDKYNHERYETKGYKNFRRLESATTPEEWADAAGASGRYVKVFRYEYANPQMSAQQSIFTVAGEIGDRHDEALARCLSEPWQRVKVIIAKADKEQLRRRLFAMNVGPLSLFPTPTGVGSHISEAMRSNLSLGDETLIWSLDELTRRPRAR
jgi:hypothetical protein